MPDNAYQNACKRTYGLLEKQLQLLSEQSENADVALLAQLSEAMVNIARLILLP